MRNVTLRPVVDGDLAVFFEHQLDPEANRMAAFTGKDPADREAFHAHWARILADDGVSVRTILSGDRIAGHVASFLQAGKREVTYWVGKEHWGRGVATRALAALLEEDRTRPIHARVAKDNAGSIRVLEKCGFAVVGEDKGFAHGRGEEVEEFILELR